MTGFCPRCPTALVSARGAAPWCPACEWNLDLFEPHRRDAEFGWSWIDRFTHRTAYRLTARQFTELLYAPLDRVGARWTRIVLTVAAVLLLLLVLLIAAVGVWLIQYRFPSLMIVPGLMLLAVAFALRPRLGRLDGDLTVLDRDEAPELFDLVDRVCAAIGARPPHVIGVDHDFNAYTTTVGLRRRRVLCLGLPLWAVLDPQERVALLGHEAGHFVNGDVRRGPLTHAAMTTLGRLAVLSGPGPENRENGVFGLAAGLVQWMVSRLLFGLHLVLVWIGLRDSQRAEYLADEMAARVGGSAAAMRLADVLMLETAIDTVIRREARAGRAGDAWRAAADVARVNLAGSLSRLRQLSRRDDVSLFATHPPAGLRAAMLGHRPQREAEVVLSARAAARMDAELAGHMEHARQDLVDC